MGILARLLGRFRGPALPHAPDPSDAPIPQSPVTLPRGGDEGPYRVREGDTLETIARDAYGDPRAWRRIAEANTARLGDPPVLYPGLELRLPRA